MDMSSDEEFYDAKEAMSPRDSRNSKLADYLFDKDIGLNFDRNAPSKHDGDRLQPLGHGSIQPANVDSSSYTSVRSSEASTGTKRHSVDPVSESIIQGISSQDIPPYRRPESVFPAVYVYDESSAGELKEGNQHLSEQSPSPKEKHVMKRSKSGRLLSRLGIKGRRRRRSSGHSRNEDEAVSEDNESSSSESSDSEEGGSTTLRRHSLESGYSSILEHLSQTTLVNNHRRPPHGARYVKVKSKLKHSKEFDRIVHCQTLDGVDSTSSPDKRKLLGRHIEGKIRSKTSHHVNEQPSEETQRQYGAIWAIKFSRDGRYMAAGGQNCIIKVWEVLDTESNQKPQMDDVERKPPDQEETIKVFKDKAIREYHGHMADILDLCWSKYHFLLSSSMDKCVRLWHVSRPECLCVFKHVDFVTSISFHPKDDRFFLSGSADGKVRLWSIPEKTVSFWNHPPDNNIITAVGFTENGKTVCAGSYDGQLFFYDTQGMKYRSQMSVKSRHAKKGRKITGIQALPGALPDDGKILVTSNDSRIRLININDQSLLCRYKGAENRSMQIRASFSDDGRYVISGSDKCYVHLWQTRHAHVSPLHYLHDKGIRSDASLDDNEDIFSREDKEDDEKKHGFQRWLSKAERRSSDRLRSSSHYFQAHQDSVTCAIFAPTKTRQRLALTGKDIIYNNTPVPIENRRFLASSVSLDKNEIDQVEAEQRARASYTFDDGQIIVSADVNGCIKVWRMDCGVYDNQEHQRMRSDSGGSRSSNDTVKPQASAMPRISRSSHD